MLKLFIITLLLHLPFLGAAQTITSTLLMNQNDFDNIKAKVSALDKNWQVLTIADSALADFYRVDVNGGVVIYMQKSSDYLFIGELFKANTKQLTNITQQQAQLRRTKLLASIDKSSVLTYQATEKITAIIYAFVDVDCSACRYFHRQIAQLNEWGIEVRYLAFPRAGLDSITYQKMSSAWCATNPKVTINKLMRNEVYQNLSCKANPVAKHYHLGQLMGLVGTPAIVFEDGRLLHGFQSAEEIKAQLNRK